MSSPSKLSYRVLVSDQVPVVASAPLPNGQPQMAPPLASTLIYGDADAILVDAPTTIAEAEKLGGDIEQEGKRLTHIYITHGHGDHWFGVTSLLARFPDAKVVATPGTIAVMAVNGSPEMRTQLWDAMFPGQIDSTPVTAEPLESNILELEGNELHVVEVGHSDTDNTTVLHVPSLDLVVAGDVAYNGVHMYLAESVGGGRDAWLDALDVVEKLQPKTVVAGHKDQTADDDATRVLAETRAYIADAGRLLDEGASATDYFNAITSLHPTRLNTGAAWISANALCPQ